MAEIVTASDPVASVELKARVEYRRRELIAEAVEHKKNSSRPGAAEAVDRIKERLAELQYIVKHGLAAPVALEEWISR